MDKWILRPGFETRQRPAVLSVVILGVDADGKETELEDLVLARESSPAPWEQESPLEELVQGQIDQRRRRLILDLGALDKVDSTGIGDVVAAFQRTTELGGELVLANLRPKFRQLFHRTELDRLIPAYDSIQEALRHFGA